MKQPSGYVYNSQWMNMNTLYVNMSDNLCAVYISGRFYKAHVYSLTI